MSRFKLPAGIFESTCPSDGLRNYRKPTVSLRRVNQPFLLAIGFTIACQSGDEYGIGTHCDEYRSCRDPLVCRSKLCALREHFAGSAGVSGASIDATGASMQAPSFAGGTSGGGSPRAGSAGTQGDSQWSTAGQAWESRVPLGLGERCS